MTANVPALSFAQPGVDNLRRSLETVKERFAPVLGDAMSPDKLFGVFLFQVERNPKLLECTAPSLMGALMTFGVLRLECDGATGQGYVLPFKHRASQTTRAQALIGYKGYNTLGWRAGLTINGGLWLEGDDHFEFQEGTGGYVHHKRKLGGETTRRVLAAWATATAPGRDPIIKIMSIDELEWIREKAPGKDAANSPWKDPKIGVRAMYEKSVKRRLSRNTPIITEDDRHFHLAAAVEQHHEEMGQHAALDLRDGRAALVVDGDEVTPPLGQSQPQPETPLTVDPGPTKKFPIRSMGQPVYFAATAEEWAGKMILRIENYRTPERAEEFWDKNATTIDDLSSEFPQHVKRVGAAFDKKTGRNKR